MFWILTNFSVSKHMGFFHLLFGLGMKPLCGVGCYFVGGGAKNDTILNLEHDVYRVAKPAMPSQDRTTSHFSPMLGSLVRERQLGAAIELPLARAPLRWCQEGVGMFLAHETGQEQHSAEIAIDNDDKLKGFMPYEWCCFSMGESATNLQQRPFF